MTRWSRLNYLHLAVAAAGLGLFLATGQYMHRGLDHLRGMADAPRVLYRSAHIYILFAALLHGALAAYITPLRNRVGAIVQLAGSLFLVAALALFAYGFFVETPPAVVERPMIRLGIGFSFWGVALHVLAGYAGRNPSGGSQTDGA